MRAHERHAPQSGARRNTNRDAAAEAAASEAEAGHRPDGHHPHGRLLRSDDRHDWWLPTPNAGRVEMRSRTTGEIVEVLPCGPQLLNVDGTADSERDDSGSPRTAADPACAEQR